MNIDKKIRTSSHIIPLSRAFELSNGDVLEIGTGYFSTELIHWLAHIYKRNVFSYEADPRWYKRALRVYSQDSTYHKILFVEKYDDIPCDKHWGLVFIDHSPANRRIEEIKKFADKADYLVIHDTEPEFDEAYQYSKIWPIFKYIYHYKKVRPWTSVVSNFYDLDFLKDS